MATTRFIAALVLTVLVSTATADVVITMPPPPAAPPVVDDATSDMFQDEEDAARYVGRLAMWRYAFERRPPRPTGGFGRPLINRFFASSQWPYGDGLGYWGWGGWNWGGWGWGGWGGWRWGGWGWGGWGFRGVSIWW